MKKKITALAMTAMVLLGGCAQMQPAPEAKPAGEPSAAEAGDAEEKPSAPEETADIPSMTLPESVSVLNRTIFSALVRNNPDENLFYSPFSLSSALSAAMSGAKGETALQMGQVLGITDIEAFLDSYKAYCDSMPEEGAKLTTANALMLDQSYVRENGPVKEDFTKKLQDKMQAEIRELDFRNDLPSAKKEISDWVEKNTEGMIADYNSSADETTVLDLINAIYFFGEWQEKFAAEDTWNQTFHGKQKDVEVPMMHNHGLYLNYAEKADFRALELPYLESGIAMDLILPKEETGDADWEAVFAEENDILSALDESEKVKVEALALPKFEEDQSLTGLRDILVQAGMKDAFASDRADFTGIAPRLYISDVAHRAKIEVDEEGSRAAAVTEVIMALGAAAPEEDPLLFICDRPFLYVIREVRTNTVLFTGLMNQMQ